MHILWVYTEIINMYMFCQPVHMHACRRLFGRVWGELWANVLSHYGNHIQGLHVSFCNYNFINKSACMYEQKQANYKPRFLYPSTKL